jgi:hypothetical protein
VSKKFVNWGRGLVAYASETTDAELVSELLCGSLFDQVTDAIEIANDELNFGAAQILTKARDMFGFEDFSIEGRDGKPIGVTTKINIEFKNQQPEFMAFVGKFCDKKGYALAKNAESFTYLVEEESAPEFMEKLQAVDGVIVSEVGDEKTDDSEGGMAQTAAHLAKPTPPPAVSPAAKTPLPKKAGEFAKKIGK